PPVLILGKQPSILLHKKPRRSVWGNVLPRSAIDAVGGKPLVFCGAESPKLGPLHHALARACGAPDKDGNGDALLNIKDVFVFAAVGGFLLLLAIAVKV